MTQQKRPSKSNLRVTHIPLSIEVGSTLGIVNFPTERYALTLQKPIASVKNHQQEITYKNAVGKVSDSEDEDDEYARKKIVTSNRVTIKAENVKRKYFRVDIPIQKGAFTGVKNNREKINFVIEFNQDKRGTLTVIDDVFDTQVEITNQNTQFSMEERIKISEMKLDARRKEEKVEVDDKKDGRKKEK